MITTLYSLSFFSCLLVTGFNFFTVAKTGRVAPSIAVAVLFLVVFAVFLNSL